MQRWIVIGTRKTERKPNKHKEKSLEKTCLTDCVSEWFGTNLKKYIYGVCI